MSDQLHRMAIPCCNKYLRREAANPTRYVEICGNLGTQCLHAVYRWMSHGRWLHSTYTARAQACPDLSGERIQGRQTHLERQNRIWTKTSCSNVGLGPG